MGRMYKVTVRGTGQLNGPLKVDKTVIMEEQMAAKFNGGSRYEVIEAFVKTNYPGIRIDSIRSFGANVVLIPEEKESKEKSSKNISNNNQSASSKSIDDDFEEEESKSSNLKNIIGGAILGALSSEKTEKLEDETREKKKDFDYETEKEKIDLLYYKKQKELELEKQKNKEKLRQQKNEELEKKLNNGGSKLEYHLLKFWFSLDKPWKKIVFGYAVVFIIIEILMNVFGLFE